MCWQIYKKNVTHECHGLQKYISPLVRSSSIVTKFIGEILDAEPKISVKEFQDIN